MSGATSAAAPVPAAAGGGSWTVFAILVLGSLTTVAAIFAGNGNVVVALAPVAIAAALAWMWFAPVRSSLLIVVFVSLTVDSIDEGPWNSPLAPFGSLLANNLNKSIAIEALAVPGVMMLLGLLTLIHLHRHLSGRRIDAVGHVRPANVTLLSVGASFLAVVALCLIGFKYGGNMQMAKVQVQTFVMVLLVAYLASMSLRGMRDYRILGGIVLAAACIKSLQALWVVYVVQPPIDATTGKLAFATTHGDSMLFASAAVLLIARFAEQPIRRNAMLCAALLPLLVIGMVVNNRRLVWVELIAALVTFWFVSRRSKLKRLVVYAFLAALPLIAGYIAVGWNSRARVFAPIQVFRSVSDSEVDASTLYRDLENYNLIATMKSSPFIGTGFGQPFNEVVTLPDISFFKEYEYLPHNSVIGLWAYCGAFGFTGLVLALVVGLYLAACSYQVARSADERTAAFMVIGVVVVYLMHCWGDIGFSERRGIFLVGPALAMAGQLAVSTGAWRVRAVRRRT